MENTVDTVIIIRTTTAKSSIMSEKYIASIVILITLKLLFFS